MTLRRPAYSISSRGDTLTMALSKNLERTLHKALSVASDRKHEYATLEHLLLAFMYEPDILDVLQACGANIEALRQNVTRFLDIDLEGLATDKPGDPKPTAGFQRVVQRAAIHVQSSGRDEVASIDVLQALFGERESHSVHFLTSQEVTRDKVVHFRQHGEAKRTRPTLRRAPPELPSQGIAPHVEIGSDGIIGYSPAEELDQDGNHLPSLRALHPDLQELASELNGDLSRGNIPHAVLGQRVAFYASIVCQDLSLIDFRRLYAAGVRLANAATATYQAISAGDLPPLDFSEREKLESLLMLHGPFILATSTGSMAVEEERRYQRNPADEKRYRSDSVAIAKLLQNRPDLIDSDVVEQMLGSAQEIGQGGNPERSSTAGRAMVRNVAIGLASGAVGSAVFVYASSLILGAGAITAFVGTLAISETIKKTQWFQNLTKSLASKLDGTIDASSKEAIQRFRSGLLLHSQFVRENQASLRQLMDGRSELEFLRAALDWLDEIPKEKPEGSERDDGAQRPPVSP